MTGSLNDFRDVPGIASLVTFLLMAGSKQHSDIWYEFNTITDRHRGNVDCRAKLDRMIFAYEVDSNHLADTLNR